MKRVHCLFSIALLSVLFPAHALSQGYEPILQEGKQWYLKSLYGYYKDWQFFVNGDTIVDGVPGHQFCWTMVADEQTDSIVGILPTDTDGRLFIDFHDNTGQTCLYDFTLNVGDSLPPAKIRVSSLESVWCYRHVRAARDTVINGVMRKCLTIHETLCKGPASAYETDTYWIEGVGSVLGVLTPFNFNSVTTMNAVLDSCLLDGQVIARRDDFISMQEKDLRESIPHRGGHSGEPIQNASEPMFTEGKAWDVSYGENLHIRSVVVGDSVVEGRVLKVCRDSVYHTGNTGMTEDDGQISLSLFYEDGCGHVYKYDNGRMALLYDFSLNVGDTVSVGGLDSNARLDVTRVDSVHVDGNARKRLTVRETVRHPASGIATTHDCDGRGRWPFI